MDKVTKQSCDYVHDNPKAWLLNIVDELLNGVWIVMTVVDVEQCDESVSKND